MVGGEVDRIISYEGGDRDGALRELEREASAGRRRPVRILRRLRVVEIDETYLSYLPGTHARSM